MGIRHIALGSRTRSPEIPLKSRALRVTSSSPCSSAVAAMSASGMATRERASRPACSAIVASTFSSRNGERTMRTSSSSLARPLKSSALVTTEYAMRWPLTVRRRAPRSTSMKTSVSRRRSATQSEAPLASAPSLASGRVFEIWDRAEACVDDPLHIGSGRNAQVGIDRVAHDGRECLSLAAPTSVECLSLSIGQVDLRSRRSHIQHKVQHACEASPMTFYGRRLRGVS